MANDLKWSSKFTVSASPTPRGLTGDKITLPQSALEQLLAAATEGQGGGLPHPLTFRLVNPENSRAIYAGIREFSAEDGHIGLSAFLRAALGLEDKAGELTVHAKRLPKGTYVRLRPLEAGYDEDDWKPLLERYLRQNFTTLTKGELLSVPGQQQQQRFQLLVDKVQPDDGDAICVVDTDLEVDIEALSEEQARETLKRRLEKQAANKIPPSSSSSTGGIVTVGDVVSGQVVPGVYVYYELRGMQKDDSISLDLEATDGDIDLLASPFTAHQRRRPREDEFVFADLSSESHKHVGPVDSSDAEALLISVHPWLNGDEQQQDQRPLAYTLHITAAGTVRGGQKEEEEDVDMHEPGDVQCKNCRQWVPQRSLFLHENFCYRNNVACPKCNNVFQKRSAEWQNHWHCPYDSYHGNDPASKQKHDTMFHEKVSCPNCSFKTHHGLTGLAAHRTSTCPAKPILCRFCHLEVPQQGESDPDVHDPAVVLSDGLTPHEVVDGGRTTECHLCGKIVRLRDMRTHIRFHDLERFSRPMPRICLNRNCGRTVNNGNDNNATLGLCSICFGPLYVDTYDPEGKSLRRRIERRYLSQLLTGCGKQWCRNQYCKTGRQNSAAAPLAASAADILKTIRPLIDPIRLPPSPHVENTTPFYFCTDRSSQRRRVLADTMAQDHQLTGGKEYQVEWCVAALETSGDDLDKAAEWLSHFSRARGESMDS